MGTFSIMHWLVVLAVVLLLFGGRGKISSIMGDFGKGLRSFKTGLKGDEQDADGAEDDVEDVAETAAGVALIDELSTLVKSKNATTSRPREMARTG